ncbi:MAG: MFS transporter [Phycisphaerales bacterium]|nr:MFS transporter [Phycisphaerales bacterium]
MEFNSSKTSPWAVLDSLPWSRIHTTMTLVLGIGWLFDAFEVNLTGGLLGILKTQWHLSNEQASLITSLWLAGIMVGALLFGYLADRFGRKKLFLLTLTVYSAFTLCSALSPGFIWFMVFRFLTAIGVGAEYSAINGAIGELLPIKYRGRAAAIVMNFWPVGALLAALVSILFLNLVPQQAIAWRMGFALGAIGGLFVAYFRRVLPESPRWLFSRGRRDDSQQVVASIASAAGVVSQPSAAGDAVDTTLADGVAARHLFASLWELVTCYPFRLLLGCALDLSEAFGYYGLFTFLALVVLPQVHIADTQMPWFYLFGNVGALAGGLLMAWRFDQLGRKVTVPVFYSLAAITSLLMAPAAGTHSPWLVLIAFMAANFCATGAWTSAYPTFSEIFPTHLRATGIGTCVAVGRIGAIASGPLLIAVSKSSWGNAGVFGLMGFLWLFGALVMIPWALWGVEGAGISLEAMIKPVAVGAGEL